MNNTKQILEKILNNDHDFCCLCFEILEDELPIHFEDEVCLFEKKIKIIDILLAVFGAEHCKIITVFDAMCQNCSSSVINSYSFLVETITKTRFVSNALEHLHDSIDSVPKKFDECRVLFVSLNPIDCTTKQYFDNIGLITNNSEAFQRFQIISDLKTPKQVLKQLPKTETKQAVRNATITKQSPQHKRIKYQLHDMLYDKGTDVIQCKECLKVYTTLDKLKHHYIRVHGPKTFKCDKCNRSYSSLSLLETHKHISHVTVVCTECGKVFRNRHTLRMHEKYHFIRIVCQDCGRVYRNQNTYKKHFENNICQSKTRHSPADAKFTCDYCQKKYSQKISLRVHIQYEHLNYKWHVCEWCNKNFSCQSRLKAHIVKHTKEKNFPCEYCEGKFVTKESLLYHTRIHTGEKPYKCEHCDSTFLSASRRATHVKSQHLNATVECDICNCKFKSHLYLRRHKKIHSNINDESELTSFPKSKEQDHESPKFRAQPFQSKYKANKLESNFKILQSVSEKPQIRNMVPEHRIQFVYEERENSSQVDEVEEIYLEVSDEEVYEMKVSENVEV